MGSPNPAAWTKPYKIIEIRVHPHLEERIIQKQKGLWIRGVTSNLSIVGYIAFLFEVNEYLPKDHKLTDYQLCLAIRREFPSRKKIQRLQPVKTAFNKIEDTLPYIRGRYNRGELFTSRPGRRGPISFRYNERGERLKFKGTHLMTEADYEDAIRRYGPDSKQEITPFDWKAVKPKPTPKRKKKDSYDSFNWCI